ncbi:MAG: hypothetical protein VW226_02465 [Rhodospirillaceae bacterium]
MVTRLIEIVHWGVLFIAVLMVYLLIDSNAQLIDWILMAPLLLMFICIPGVIWYFIEAKFYLVPWGYKRDSDVR